MDKRLSRLCVILAAGACLFGFVIATPSLAPTASADQLPNGYNVTCTPMNSDGGVNCAVSGCPRVKDDEAGDVVHVRFNTQPQVEIVKGCNDTIGATPNFLNSTVDVASGFTFSVQGCRKHKAGSDDCGAWSIYTYKPQAAPAPPQAPPVPCPAGSPVASVPQGQQCPAAPQVNCPQGSPTPKAASLDQCAAVAPTKCPPGSVTDTAPPGQQCAAPANAVAINITQNGFNANAAITNNSSLPAKCAYTATKTSGLGPQTVNRNIDVGPNTTNAITDMLWPPLFTSYNAVVECTVTYNGKQTSIGRASQPVSG
jgi:hypothetical protein